jgi:TRAP-type C4-dicarboxylate transport system permease large subunit
MLLAGEKYTLLLLINALLLFPGTFMDLAPMRLICPPIFLPIVTKFGIDAVHWGSS